MSAPTVLPLVEGLAAVVVPAEPTDRRQMLRTLATEAEDFPPLLLERLVHQLAAPGLSIVDRQDAWADLAEAAALLAAVGAGQVEPHAIVPGARPSEAYTVAAEVLEEDIGKALDVLLADPRGGGSGGARVTGHPNHQTDTSKPLDPTEGACTCGYVGRAATAAAHIERCAAWWVQRRAGGVPERSA